MRVYKLHTRVCFYSVYVVRLAVRDLLLSSCPYFLVPSLHMNPELRELETDIFMVILHQSTLDSWMQIGRSVQSISHGLYSLTFLPK